jgi:hypothetical protein
VVIDVTSTVNVDPSGSTWAVSTTRSNTNTVALGAGLGAGLGVPLLLAIAFLFWFVRHRNRKHADLTLNNPTSSMNGPHDFSGRHEMDQTNVSPPPPAQSPFSRKAVGSPPSQPSAISPISPTNSPSRLRGPELSGQDARTEMPGFSATPELAGGARAATTSPGPPPYTQGAAAYPQGTAQGQAQELSPQQTGGRWVWHDHGSGGQVAGAGEGRWELASN